MKESILVKLRKIYKKFKKIEIFISSSSVLNHQNNFKRYSQEYVRFLPLVTYFKKWKKIKKNIHSTESLLNDTEFFKIAEDELKVLNSKLHILENKLYKMLIPLDSNDKKNCFIEIRAATGGDEAAIFSGDLFKMYGKYAEYKRWNLEIINYHDGEKGGFKDIILKIVGKGVYGKLKFESGGHRVQRIPKTESQGRIHTSTCTVAVMPEVKESKDFIIYPSDLKIDTFKSSGAGGQHVNTTDSAIRITHIPTGTVVECQDERSQHKNKSKALSILYARIYEKKIRKEKKKNSSIRKNLLGTGERSDRNRTYNFPKNRVTDHRINLTLYCLQDILNGKLDILIKPIIEAYNIDYLSDI